MLHAVELAVFGCSTIKLHVVNFFRIRSAVMRRSDSLALAGTVCRYSRSSVMYACNAKNSRLTNASTRLGVFRKIGVTASGVLSS